MSNFTFSVVVKLVTIVLGFVTKSIHFIYTIIDLIDDGSQNSSVETPSWVSSLESTLSKLIEVAQSLEEISNIEKCA